MNAVRPTAEVEAQRKAALARTRVVAGLALAALAPACSPTEPVAPVDRIPIWPEGPPTSNGIEGPAQRGNCITDIAEAVLWVRLPAAQRELGPTPAFVVCPGGGYQAVCIEREGWETASWLNERGIAAFVLEYRLPNGHARVPGDDLRRALALVRERAEEWNVDAGRVGVWGYSAGGHLAATVATGASGHADARPDLLVLWYPVLSMDAAITHAGSRRQLVGRDAELAERYSLEGQVDPQTPATRLFHCEDDVAVPWQNSARFVEAAREQGVRAELSTYPTGGHGPGALDENPAWSDELQAWLAGHGWL